MIRAELFVCREGTLKGFHIRGHAGTAAYGQDVLCAFVSSAAYMAANTITEVVGALAEVSEDDGDMYVMVNEKDLDSCQVVLAGLKLHLEETEKQYPKHLQVTLTEV